MMPSSNMSTNEKQRGEDHAAPAFWYLAWTQIEFSHQMLLHMGTVLLYSQQGLSAPSPYHLA